MAYSQNTIISANAANALYTVLDGLLATAGWSVVETLTPSGTYRTKVYKSATADNQAGYDWYLAVMWNTVGTEQQFQIIPGTAYDQPTHVMTVMPNAQLQNGSVGTQWADPVTGDTWGGFNVNVATSTVTNISAIGTSRPTTTTRKWWATIVPSSAFGYWLSVTLDHVALFTTIATVNGPPNFFTSTLDIAPEWLALNSSGFGNGVTLNPVVMITGTGTNAITSHIGISSSIKGSLSGSRLAPAQRVAANVGSPLPIIAGNWLPAFAWRSAYYLSRMVEQGPGTVPAWDAPVLGDGFHIGDGIDYYQVHGGSLGDTVQIDGGTYVLSGPIMNNTAAVEAGPLSIAVLVE